MQEFSQTTNKSTLLKGEKLLISFLTLMGFLRTELGVRPTVASFRVFVSKVRQIVMQICGCACVWICVAVWVFVCLLVPVLLGHHVASCAMSHFSWFAALFEWRPIWLSVFFSLVCLSAMFDIWKENHVAAVCILSLSFVQILVTYSTCWCAQFNKMSFCILLPVLGAGQASFEELSWRESFAYCR